MLSADQQFAYNCIKEGKNLFITSRAGCGKSYLINYIKNHFPGNVIVCGSTGIAACNVGGRTLHSQFMIPPNIDNFDINALKRNRQQAIKRAKLLIIDEISMVSAKILNLVSEICCTVRECREPFGGIQVLFFGDYLQLPPVDIQDGVSLCCDIWQKSNIYSVLLTTNHRQSEDKVFYDILTDMRYNRLTVEDCLQLSKRFTKDPPEKCIRLFGTNAQVDSYNDSKYSALDEQTEHIYEMECFGDSSLINAYLKNSLLEEVLKLRVGARVMSLVNGLADEDSLYNGSLGTVESFTKDGLPVIKFDNGIKTVVQQKSFVITERVITEDEEGKEVIDIKTLMEIIQIPLKLAWGITIHKSQGLTFDNVYVDCSRIFAPGQIYVAFSRCRSLRGLYLNAFNPRTAFCDSSVVAWYLQLESAYSC